MTNLAQLSTGEQGVIKTIDPNSPVSVRLLEMGLTPGCSIKMLGSAPLGDPLEFEVRGYRLSLRREEAALIELQS